MADVNSKVRASDAAPKILLEGAYRLHPRMDAETYTSLAVDAFPNMAKRINCFGSSWHGCLFATDHERIIRGEPQILLLEPGTGEALEIPFDIAEFHEMELVENPEAAVAHSFFKQWLGSGGAPPKYGQCVGYRKPLFLGGADETSNLAISDFNVYWTLTAQMLKKVRGLPEGTRIGNMSISD